MGAIAMVNYFKFNIIIIIIKSTKCLQDTLLKGGVVRQTLANYGKLWQTMANFGKHFFWQTPKKIIVCQSLPIFARNFISFCQKFYFLTTNFAFLLVIKNYLEQFRKKKQYVIN